jgi:uncharacterized membrane protein
LQLVARLGTWAAMVTMTVTALWLVVVAVIIVAKGVGTPVVSGLPAPTETGQVTANAAAVYGIGAAIGVLALLLVAVLVPTWAHFLRERRGRA